MSRPRHRTANTAQPLFHMSNDCWFHSLPSRPSVSRYGDVSAPDRIRTYDTFFRREVLYPLSYWGSVVFYFNRRINKSVITNLNFNDLNALEPPFLRQEHVALPQNVYAFVPTRTAAHLSVLQLSTRRSLPIWPHRRLLTIPTSLTLH